MANIITNRWAMSRRSVLRGIGATVALPFLEAMRPLSAATGAASTDPIRMACLFFPNGVRPDAWKPKGSGSSYKLSPILSPLESLREDILVISGLVNKPAHNGDGHYAKCASWLTCEPIQLTDGSDISANGISIDQIAAEKVGQLTKMPSLELGIEPVRPGVDKNVKLTKLYGSHISWKQPDVPLPCEIHPRAAFDRLFKDRRKNVTDGPALNPDTSVLDIILSDAKRLQRDLGTEDTQKLSQYLDSVREVERRIQNESSADRVEPKITPEVLEELNKLKSEIGRSVKGNGREGNLRTAPRIDPEEHVKMMMDLMVLAFWSDTTRVSSFMFGNSVSNKNFSFLDGVDGSHHSISHHKNDPKQMDQYEKINTWHIEQYAYMLNKMKNIKEGNGTLLDKSMVLIGSGIMDGNKHNARELPIIVGGNANGQIRTGRHLDTGGAPLSGLYKGMLTRMGVEKPKFGDARSELRNM